MSMMPIDKHLTPELLDAYDPTLRDFMLKVLSTHNTDLPNRVYNAISKSEAFKMTMSAAISAMENTPKESKTSGGAMLVTLCLVAGWQLCESALAREVKSE